MKKLMKVFAPMLAAACALALVVVVAPQAANPAANPIGAQGDDARAAAVAAKSEGDALSNAASNASSEGAAPDAVAAAQPAYESDAVLVSLADGVTPDDLLASFADAPASNCALAGATIEKRSENYVKLALPAGMSAEDALDQLDGNDLVKNAQFNFYYYPAEATGAARGAKSSGVTPSAANSTAFADLAAATPASLLATQALTEANDPYYKNGGQWSLASVNAPEAWSLVNDNVQATSAVTVAVIDAGFLASHQDLEAHVVDTYNADTGGSSIGTAYSSHGTHVAGIVSAVTNNKKGVASVANNAVGLMLVRASDSAGSIDTETIVDAYAYIVKKAKLHNVRVVNMSLGSGSFLPISRSSDAALYDAIGNAREAGIVTVVAACNMDEYFRPPFYAYPSDFDNVVSVINLTQADNSDGVERDSSSNYSKTLNKTEKNISAPGMGVFSTYSLNKSSYKKMDGTSMAAPLVAGVLGLMFTVNPKLTAEQATVKLYSSARDLTADPASKGWDRYTGWGEVDAAAAVRAAGAADPASEATAKTSVATLSIAAKSATYSGKALKPKVTVKNGSATLKEGTDYSVSYRDNKSTGRGAFTVRGKGAYCGIAVGTFNITDSLKSVALVSSSATYNGKSRKPEIKSVKAASGVVPTSSFKVAYYRNGKKTSDFKSVGTITVKVTGSGDYKGTASAKFTINPKGTRITKLSAGNGKITAIWAKQSAQTSGYRLQFATNKKFTANLKKKGVSGASATRATATSLKHKKVYYVRVRTYKTVAGTTYYSSWSPVKRVKTK